MIIIMIGGIRYGLSHDNTWGAEIIRRMTAGYLMYPQNPYKAMRYAGFDNDAVSRDYDLSCCRTIARRRAADLYEDL